MNTFCCTCSPGTCCPLLWTHSAAHALVAAAVPSCEHILLHMPSWHLLSPPMNTFCCTCSPGTCCPLLWTHSASHAFLAAAVLFSEHILLHMLSWHMLFPPMNTFCCTCPPGGCCPLLWTHSAAHALLATAVPSFLHACIHTWPIATSFLAQSAFNFLRKILLFYADKMWYTQYITQCIIFWRPH